MPVGVGVWHFLVTQVKYEACLLVRLEGGSQRDKAPNKVQIPPEAELMDRQATINNAVACKSSRWWKDTLAFAVLRSGP